ncbi:zinc ribbon domain-containing protein [Candidatus Thorarchaeota archaeon]|nr:MAG: zinc ribbon domain-containing protein [Candidatus Thorarchaeota archaeon]
MADRPVFLTVSYGDKGLSTMKHEQKMIREDDVKFDGEDGILECTDVRLVWYKKPSRWGKVKKFGGLAGAIAGAAILDGVGRQMGGIGGRAVRGIGRGIGYAAVGTAISSWTRDSFYNKDEDGNTESIALPMIAMSNVAQSGKKLVVELKSGGNMIFEFKQKKVIPSVLANVKQAQNQGKCPFCGANAGNAVKCPNCGAPITGGGGGGGSAAGGKFCTNCGEAVPADAKFCGKCGSPV